MGSALAVLSLGLVTDNVRRLRVPSASPPATDERVSVLIPARDEAEGLGTSLPALRTAMDATGLAAGGAVELVVLDDGSRDATAAVVSAAAREDRRVRLLRGTPPPAGWGGKAWACQRLAAAAPASSVLVFLDADVVLAPHAIAAAVAMLRRSGLDLLSPVPRLEAAGVAERLVQPLLAWSWLSTLPLAAAERAPHPLLAAAVGGFLVVDAEAYRRSGGHGAEPGAVLDDIALLRSIKRDGGHGVVAAGTTLARCRMYRGAAAVRDGYGKSLWAAFGGGPTAVGVLAALTLAYVVPPVAALRGSRIGLLGTAAGIGGRMIAAHHTGSRRRDAVAHPLSIVALVGLTVDPHVRHHRGTLRWRSRPLTDASPPPAPAAVSPTAAAG